MQLTAIGLSPGGSGYFTRIQNTKLVTTEFKSGGLHEKHVVIFYRKCTMICSHDLGIDGRTILKWMERFAFAQDRNKCQAVVNTAMNNWVPQNSGNFLTS